MPEPKLTVPRAAIVNGLYQLAWGLPMLLQGAEMLRPGIGDYPGLADPLPSTWIRLVGTTLLGMALLNVALSRVRDPAAQRWIRFGWIAFWTNDDGDCARSRSRSCHGIARFCSGTKEWPMSPVPNIDSRSKTGAPITAARKRSV